MKSFYNTTPNYFGWGHEYGFFSNYRICLEQLIDFDEWNENIKKVFII